MPCFLGALKGVLSTSALPCGPVHQLANISKTSTAFWILSGTLAGTRFFLR